MSRYEEAIKEREDAKTSFLDAKAQLQKSSGSGGSEPCKCSSLIQACEEENSKLLKKLSDLESLEMELREELNECKVKSQRLEAENKSLKDELKDTENLKLKECKEKVEKELKEIQCELEKVKKENKSLVEKGVGEPSENIYEYFVISKGVRRWNPIVFFDMKLRGMQAGRIVMELFADTAPRLTEIFRKLCTGEMLLPGYLSRLIGYKGTDITFFYNQNQIRGGNVKVDHYGELYSIYGGISNADRVSRPHTGHDDLFLFIDSSNIFHTFIINCVVGQPHTLYPLIGRVIQGMEVVQAKNAGLPEGRLMEGTFVIEECGQLF